jgi:adenylosuccinate synthase
MTDIKTFLGSGFFTDISVLVDGQFGSTGKGLIAGALAESYYKEVNVVTSNAAPNSGHTSYFNGEKIVLKQLPTFSVIADKMFNAEKCENNIVTYLNGGAVIKADILQRELETYSTPNTVVHPHCAVIKYADVDEDSKHVNEIASTGQGVGPSIMRKLTRNKVHVVEGNMDIMPKHLFSMGYLRYERQNSYFVEISQGNSLGLNAGFYPHVTSRQCNVAQALADAELPVQAVKNVIMSLRTYPIRVGNTTGSSGDCYMDQRELEWSEIGITPETTTVTGRQRRIFTWSELQFKHALRVNRPNVLFVNFMNYLPETTWGDFLENRVYSVAEDLLGFTPKVLIGKGPLSIDIEPWVR